MATLSSIEREFALWSDTWDLKDGHYTLCGVQKLISCNDPEALKRIISGLDPSVIPNGGSLHVFRAGIEPLYDHPANASGGHFKMQATSVQAAGDVWALLTEHLLSDWLPRCPDVNGVTYMRTLNTRGIKLWLRDSLDKEAVRELRLFLQGLQNNQTDFVNLKFCPHKYILKTLHSQQKGSAPSPKSGPPPAGDHHLKPSSVSELYKAPAELSASSSSSPPPRPPAINADATATFDGAATIYALPSPAGGNYLPTAGLLGQSNPLAQMAPYHPAAVWLLYLQNLYRQQQMLPPAIVLLGSYPADPSPSIPPTPQRMKAPSHSPASFAPLSPEVP
eukprot:GGOE01010826.1.p1 GENE.GGOE01010826.1~~GGOE01010826.1.p1  ORF type:complete len:345 (-),score=57.61 GGOE01010826.1:1343-2344(-)